MEAYQPRKVEFRQLLTCGAWRIKVYTVTHHVAFGSPRVLANVIAQLPNLLAKATALEYPLHYFAFLIVHEGRDGVWSLLNCWVGDDMLYCTTYFTSYDRQEEITLFPQTGFMGCVWELAVVSFERAIWVEHVLKNARQPDWATYSQLYLHKDV